MARPWPSRCSRATPATRRRSESRSTRSNAVSNFHTWRWSATAAWSRRRGSARSWRQPGSTGSAASGHRRSPHSPVTPGHCSSPCSTSAIWQRSPRPTFPVSGSLPAAIRRWPRRRARKREELLQATDRRLTRIANEVRRKPAKHDAGVIGLAVGAVIDKHKMKKHFALDIADGRFTFHRRQEEIAAEARLDGIYVIRTSLPANKIGSEAAVAAYKNLALVERAFRTLKGVDLQVRPVHHWLEHRVKAHVFLCMLAYYVEHHMRNALAPILFADHQPEARERASIVAPTQPSPAAIEKCTKRRAVDGTPIMAWHDLIGQLGTLTINEVALPLGERRTIQMLARATALQEQAFALLGVPPPRVQ